MTCLKSNKQCSYNTDCMPSNSENTPGCLNLLCASSGSSSGTCTSTVCTGDQQCTQFGDNFKCVNGYCVNYACNSTTPCPSSMMCGPNGVCVSQSCANGGCPKGAQCKTLSDGSKVCLNDPGLPLGLFTGSVLLLIFVICVIYLILTSNYIRKRSTNA